LGSRALGTVTAYAAAIAAFAYALMSLYWAVGGRGLVSTVGGYVEQFAHRGGPIPVLVALAATVAKVAGGLLALALIRPWGRAIRRGWLLAGAAAASALLVLYGAVNVAVGALVLSGAIHPAGRVDRTALRWHAGSGTCGSWCGAFCWRWLPEAIGGGPATGAADPGSRNRKLASPPDGHTIHSSAGKRAHRACASCMSCRERFGRRWCCTVGEQVKFPPLPGDRDPSAGDALPDLPSDRRLPARQPQRGADRALPPGPSRSARPSCPVAGRQHHLPVCAAGHADRALAVWSGWGGRRGAASARSSRRERDSLGDAQWCGVGRLRGTIYG